MRLRLLIFAALAAALPVAVAVVANAYQAAGRSEELETRITLSGEVLRARIDAEAARQGEAAQALASHAAVVRSLTSAMMTESTPSEASVATLFDELAKLTPEAAPTFIALVNGRGSRVKFSSGEVESLPLAKLPLAKEGLSGAMTRAVAVLEGEALLVGVAPVAVAEAAVVVGRRIRDADMLRWRSLARATHLTLLVGPHASASTLAPESRSVLASKVAPEALVRTQIESVERLPLGLGRLLPLLAERTAGLMGSVAVTDGIRAIVAVDDDEPVRRAAQLELLGIALAGALMALGLLAVLLLPRAWLASIDAVTRHAEQLRTEPGAKRPAVAREFEAMLEAWIETVRKAVPATPESMTPLMPFSAAALPSDLPVPTNVAPPPVPSGAPSPRPVSPSVGPALATLPSAEARAPTPPASAPVPGRPVAPAAPKPPPTTAPREASLPVPADAPTPAAAPAPSAPGGAAGAPLPGAPLFEDIATPTTELRTDAGDWSPLPTLEAIFDEYVALRGRCGENTGVNRDRFLTKLEENRRTTIAQQGCRDVRFEVYEKAGRAAVRAVPVR